MRPLAGFYANAMPTMKSRLNISSSVLPPTAMPRRARLTLPDVPLHLTQRGHDRHACFFADDDYRFYLYWLERNAARQHCFIHAYVLMTNHVHLVLSAEEAEAPAGLMKAQNQRYVCYVNQRYGRSGTLWNGRFHSCLAQQENYLLICQRYVELNPVRAGMVEHPADYRWSSYRANAQGAKNSLITPHAQYLALGDDFSQRLAAYRELFHGALDPTLIEQIRIATIGNRALGTTRFAADVATILGRQSVPAMRGRPRRTNNSDGLQGTRKKISK
jgi:putative transposase